MAAELNATVLRAHARCGRSTRAQPSATRRQARADHIANLVLALGADPIRLPLRGERADGRAVGQRPGRLRTASPPPSREEHNGRAARRRLDRLRVRQRLWPRGIGSDGDRSRPPRPLARLLPEAAASGCAQRWRRWACIGTSVPRPRRVDRMRGRLRVDLADGSASSRRSCCRRSACGRARGWRSAPGLTVNRGIVTDRCCDVAAHVYALGDCAEVEGQTLPYVLPLMQQRAHWPRRWPGRRRRLVYPAMPVVVKTPACPTVVCPPPLDALGEWSEHRATDDAAGRAVPTAPDGTLLGFAVLGSAIAQRQALAARVAGFAGLNPVAQIASGSTSTAQRRMRSSAPRRPLLARAVAAASGPARVAA